MYSFTEENYLKAIFKLSERNEEAINTNAIAALLNTKAASVTDMIKKLSDKKLVKYEKYKGVQLTEKGKSIAVDTVRKHRLWETFLHDKLKFTWDEVHDVAEQLEHIQSEALIDKLEKYLGYPSADPHGDPIPGKNGKIKSPALTMLAEVKTGDKSLMSGVIDHSPAFLQHLQKIDLLPGKAIVIRERNDYDGSFRIKVDGAKELYISHDVAKNILVKIV